MQAVNSVLYSIIVLYFDDFQNMQLIFLCQNMGKMVIPNLDPIINSHVPGP